MIPVSPDSAGPDALQLSNVLDQVRYASWSLWRRYSSAGFKELLSRRCAIRGLKKSRRGSV